MKHIETDLAYVRYSNSTSAGTSLMKEMKDYARQFNNILIHADDVKNVEKDFRKKADDLLAVNPKWRDLPIYMEKFDYRKMMPDSTMSYRLRCGNEELLNITPAKTLLDYECEDDK